MARLIYSTITSLDGYVADANGRFDWAEPDEEVHRFINDLERSTGTYLLGRRMYEVMRYWESPPTVDQPSFIRDFADIWRAADKIVYSTTLDDVSTARTRIERVFDADSIREMKRSADRIIGVGGPTLAGRAFETGLVDECHLFIVPVAVGGGTRSLPDGVHVDLELLDHRRFDNGTVHLHYRVADTVRLEP